MSCMHDHVIKEQATTDGVLVFAHVGDLHLTDAKQKHFRDFLSIIAQLEVECGNRLDFVVLPGDNADNGLSAKYALVATGLKMLSVPVHVIPGDHDMEQGDLDAFYAAGLSPHLPKALTVRGTRCLFLDISRAGTGGPDFCLGAEQVSWIERELQQAQTCGQTSIVFMHSYPGDLRGEGETEALTRLLGAHDVALVDIGHTHYNEIANDGRTIFAATRSTGQIEEGPAGYSIVALDGGVVSWRFKLLDEPFPFVVITAPADYRLMRDSNHRAERSVAVRAIVLGSRAIKTVSCRAENGERIPMAWNPGQRAWSGRVDIPPQSLVSVSVQAMDETGRPGCHTIRVATPAYRPPVRAQDGSDAASIGAWPENGILGTQLGPNRNARPPSPPRSSQRTDRTNTGFAPCPRT